MARSIFLTLAVILAAAAPFASEVRQDEYVRNYGFRVEFKPGPAAGDAFHISNGKLLIQQTDATPGDQPPSGSTKRLREVVLKLAMSDANKQEAAIELGPCPSDSRKICMILAAQDLPENFRAWGRELLDKGTAAPRNIALVVVDDAGKKHTYNLIDCLPQSFGFVDYSTEGGIVINWKLEVRVQRVQLA